MLQPSMDVYLLPLSFVDYRVERRKQGRTEVCCDQVLSSQMYVFIVFRRWGERPNERVITIGIGWVLLECVTNGFSGCNFGQSNPKALFSTLLVR